MAKNQIKILGADTGLECEEVTQKDVTAFETALKNVLLKHLRDELLIDSDFDADKVLDGKIKGNLLPQVVNACIRLEAISQGMDLENIDKCLILKSLSSDNSIEKINKCISESAQFIAEWALENAYVGSVAERTVFSDFGIAKGVFQEVLIAQKMSDSSEMKLSEKVTILKASIALSKKLTSEFIPENLAPNEAPTSNEHYVNTIIKLAMNPLFMFNELKKKPLLYNAYQELKTPKALALKEEHYKREVEKSEASRKKYQYLFFGSLSLFGIAAYLAYRCNKGTPKKIDAVATPIDEFESHQDVQLELPTAATLKELEDFRKF